MTFADNLSAQKNTLNKSQVYTVEMRAKDYLDFIKSRCEVYYFTGGLSGYLYRYIPADENSWEIGVSGLDKRNWTGVIMNGTPDASRSTQNARFLHYPDEMDVDKLVRLLKEGIAELGFKNAIVQKEVIEQDVEVIKKTLLGSSKRTYEKPTRIGYGIYISLTW